jgi:AcrR family transcriptional regulator
MLPMDAPTTTSADPPVVPAAEPAAEPAGGLPEIGHRERKKRETRRLLRLTALRLVAERGLDGVTTDEIAAAADVSPRTFFNYFTSKEEALVGNDPDLVGILGGALAARPADETPLEAMRGVFLAYADTVIANQPLWQLKLQVVAANPSLRTGMVGATAELDRALTLAVAERTGTDPTADPYPALVAAVSTAAARVALQHCGIGTGDGARPLADVIRETFDALMHGLPVPAAATDR